MSQQNWRTEVDAGDYFLHQKKTLAVADRRPVIRKSSDLVGPGIATAAIRITDFNDILASFNGYYSADVGAASAPNDSDRFVGTVVMDDELGGRQVFVGLDSGEEYTRIFLRSPSDPDFIAWGGWRPTEYTTPTAYTTAGGVTSVPPSLNVLVQAPEMDTFGTPDTFARTAYTLLVKRPGVYTGSLHIRSTSTYFVTEELTIQHPDGAGDKTINLFGVPLREGLVLPLNFWTSESTGFIRMTVRQDSAYTLSLLWDDLILSRVGDAP